MSEGVDVKFGRVGTIGRFKPLHVGAASLLEALCARAEHVVIGIGSANKYNVRNPFTADEVEGMIRALLSPRFDNYTVVRVPDFGHIPEFRDGQRWKQEAQVRFGGLDMFASANAYVQELLSDVYAVVPSYELVPVGERRPVTGTIARLAMARGEDLREIVSAPVLGYMHEHGLVDRFRREFGLQTIAELAMKDVWRDESRDEECSHAREV